MCRTPHLSKIVMVASSSRCATPRSQYSGSTVRGPKNPNDPQRVTTFDPIRRPPSRAAITLTWVERQRGVMKSRSPMKSSGLGNPRNVPNASRTMRPASSSSLCLSRPTWRMGRFVDIVQLPIIRSYVNTQAGAARRPKPEQSPLNPASISPLFNPFPLPRDSPQFPAMVQPYRKENS